MRRRSAAGERRRLAAPRNETGRLQQREDARAAWPQRARGRMGRSGALPLRRRPRRIGVDDHVRDGDVQLLTEALEDAGLEPVRLARWMGGDHRPGVATNQVAQLGTLDVETRLSRSGSDCVLSSTPSGLSLVVPLRCPRSTRSNRGEGGWVTAQPRVERGRCLRLRSWSASASGYAVSVNDQKGAFAWGSSTS